MEFLLIRPEVLISSTYLSVGLVIHGVNYHHFSVMLTTKWEWRNYSHTDNVSYRAREISLGFLQISLYRTTDGGKEKNR